MNNSSAAPFALDLVVKKEVVKTKKLFSELSSETVSNIVNTSLSLQFTMLGFNIATANVVGVAVSASMIIVNVLLAINFDNMVRIAKREELNRQQGSSGNGRMTN